MFEVRISPEADDELNAAATFYESRERGLGEIFLEEIELALARLQEFPFMGSSLFEEYRSLYVQRFPFSIVYRLEEKTICVLAVAHASRRPGYWIDRG
jgi:plasmid stabilization system protein ParE